MITSIALVIAMSASAQEPQPVIYAAGASAPVEFSLRMRDREGGRLTPIFSHYRPDIALEGAARVSCTVTVPQDGGLKPGFTDTIRMTCPMPLTEGQRFEAFELGRPVGVGVVKGR
jgi:translation elongation factor EF-Tu-like GTPase